MGALNGSWSRYRKVAMDSNCFIYLMEDSPFREAAIGLFRAVEQGELLAVSSTLSVTELLTGPYRADDRRTVEEYRMTLMHFPNLAFRPVDFLVAEKAAELRSRYRLKNPDAIQLATAIVEDAEALVSNDRDFAVVDFPILSLAEGLL